MKKKLIITVIGVLMILMLGGIRNKVFAYDNLCWTVCGWPLKLTAIYTGMISHEGAYIYTINGYGTSWGIPINGTLVWPASGSNFKISFEIKAASSSQHAVVYEATLSKDTFNGISSWRWFDSSNSGSCSVIWVSCSSLSSILGTQSIKGDPASQGLEK